MQTDLFGACASCSVAFGPRQLDPPATVHGEDGKELGELTTYTPHTLPCRECWAQLCDLCAVLNGNICERCSKRAARARFVGVDDAR